MSRELIKGSCYFGADPEFFFSKGGSIIGAEKVLTGDGKLEYTPVNAYSTASNSKTGSFVLDGVQVEINPRPHHCRAHFGNELKSAFIALRAKLKEMEGIKVAFNSVVELDPVELDSLSDKAKALGCAPSKNIYNQKAKVTVDGATYLKRSAGGHIHLGLDHLKPIGGNLIMEHRQRLIPLMDIFVGNTSVMLDRDPGAAERRLNYGRAGEYRLPIYGIEYRTLSNFWLRSYQLASFVLGLSRLAVSVLYTKHAEIMYPKTYRNVSWDTEKELFHLVNMKAVIEAINTNNFDLAAANFEKVKGFIGEHVFARDSLGLCQSALPQFDYFLSKVKEKGIEYWFPEDPMEHWCNLSEGHGRGWESFLANRVGVEMKEAVKA